MSNFQFLLLASSLKEKAVGCLLGGGHLDVHVCHSRYGAIRREVSEENSFPSHNILKTTSR